MPRNYRDFNKFDFVQYKITNPRSNAHRRLFIRQISRLMVMFHLTHDLAILTEKVGEAVREFNACPIHHRPAMTRRFVILVKQYAMDNFMPSMAAFIPQIERSLDHYLGPDMEYYSDGDDDEF